MNIKVWAKEAVKRHGMDTVDTFISAYPKLSDDIEVEFNLPPCKRDGDLLKRLKAIGKGIGTLQGTGQTGMFSDVEYIYHNTNSRSPKDIERIKDAIEKGDWEWIVGTLISYRRSSTADKEREIRKHEVTFDDTNTFDIAEKIAYKNGYYSNGNSQLVDRIDAETVYETRKALFQKHEISDEDAMHYMTLAAEVLRRDIDEIVDDSRFETFLSAVKGIAK